MRNGAIIHPWHLELETALFVCHWPFLTRFSDLLKRLERSRPTLGCADYGDWTGLCRYAQDA